MTAPSASLLLGLTVLLYGLTVSAGSVILEFPNPAIAGSDVTLRCKTGDSSTHVGYFFRNATFMGHTLTGEFTINNVQHSDEGLYWCSTGLFSQSTKTWLSVKGSTPSDQYSPPTAISFAAAVSSPTPSTEAAQYTPSDPDPSSLLILRLLCHLAVVSPYFISTILMLSICCAKRKGSNTAIATEMDSRVEGGQGRAVSHDYVTAVHDF